MLTTLHNTTVLPRATLRFMRRHAPCLAGSFLMLLASGSAILWCDSAHETGAWRRSRIWVMYSSSPPVWAGAYCLPRSSGFDHCSSAALVWSFAEGVAALCSRLCTYYCCTACSCAVTHLTTSSATEETFPSGALGYSRNGIRAGSSYTRRELYLPEECRLQYLLEFHILFSIMYWPP